MSSLARRATYRQKRAFAIIEGAVKNASDVHPEIRIPKHMRSSIAKRAVGMLTSQWDSVLSAGGGPSSDRGTGKFTNQGSISTHLIKSVYKRLSRFDKRPPLGRLTGYLSRPIRDLRINGQVAEVEARISVLRALHSFVLEQVEYVLTHSRR